LSRSDKKVLHIDRNEYYGGPEAAFSLEEVDQWAKEVAGRSFSVRFLQINMLMLRRNAFLYLHKCNNLEIR
jgi:RAB protein geranylgeranyltransferase component A